MDPFHYVVLCSHNRPVDCKNKLSKTICFDQAQLLSKTKVEKLQPALQLH